MFEHRFLDELTRDDVAEWEKSEKGKGYAELSIRSWRALLHLVLADAEEDGLMGVNVAAKRKGRGKRTGHSRDRGEEKVITTALGVGPQLTDVARRAGVAVGTASAALSGRGVVAEATRARVLAAAQELGYVLGRPAGVLAAHWRRNGFATWLFQPAATGSYPQKAPRPAQPVPVLADPWPGIPARGRGAAARADACWLPIEAGLTPHGLRHTYKTLMIELRTPARLMDAQMGHADGSVQALYSHVTDGMIRDLLEGLTRKWEEALAQRRQLSARSPVAALDRLLTGGSW